MYTRQSRKVYVGGFGFSKKFEIMARGAGGRWGLGTDICCEC